MTNVVLHPAYFGSILQFSVLAKADKVVFEDDDNYQKQSYRNRQYIYGANGKLLLNIPIKHTPAGGGRQKYKDVKMENQFDWQTNHWRSLEAAYRTSPFFEFYEDELVSLYEKKPKFLLDFNYECLQRVEDCLQLVISSGKTNEYMRSYAEDEDLTDYRNLINCKRKVHTDIPVYHQVFEDKYGFLPNLSILDLLFNEGPNSLNYLENLPLPVSVNP